MKKYRECDMYAPVKELFESMGYTVNGEVNGADVAASKDGELVIAELKRGFCLKLVYQAMDRRQKADVVYAAVPRSAKGERGKDFKDMLRLLKALNIGLIVVCMDSPAVFAEIRYSPAGAGVPVKRKKEAMKRELAGRSGDYNKGGSPGRKGITAYKEASVAIACILETSNEGLKVSEIREKSGIKKSQDILSKNFYGWFERVSRGVYTLSGQGREFLNREEYAFLVNLYRDLSGRRAF